MPPTKTIRVLLSLLLIPLAACAAGKKDGGGAQAKTERAKQVAPLRAMPRSAGPASAPPSKPPAPVAAPRDLTPAPPSVIGVCDPGGCWDTGGNRYNGGASGTFLNGSGRLCQRNGVSMQCF